MSHSGNQEFKEEVDLANKPAPRKQAIRGTWVRIDQGTQEGEMANQREDDLPICEYAAHKKVGDLSCIRRPPIEANNFKFEASTTSLLNNVQFSGLPHEDPNMHISSFLQLCDMSKQNGVSDDAFRLRLFPWSLRDKAKVWLNSLPAGTITTWDAMEAKFLDKFFPPSKTAKLKSDINNFCQWDQETLYDAWERFKELLRRCPHHGFPTWMQVQIFYNGLDYGNKQLVDAAAGGSLMKKRPSEALELIEEMAHNNYQYPSERRLTGRSQVRLWKGLILTT